MANSRFKRLAACHWAWSLLTSGSQAPETYPPTHPLLTQAFVFFFSSQEPDTSSHISLPS